ncbi:EXS family-domain-containing protein [Syncephalis plumigaleata]|nr:EXS family-domain-containing protein [Syncephalis plumigaleata]
MLLFAVNVRAWTRYHVNYKFIFEVDPRDHLHFYQFLEFPGVFFVIFAYCLAFAMTDPWPNVLPARYFPAIFILIILTLLFLPFKVLYHSARRWSIIVATRIIFSGLFNVQFRDFFIADELCSLIYLFTMLQLTACTYATNWDELGAHCDYQRSWLTPFIAVLPPFWRLMQCIRRYHDSKAAWPHLANALKYSGTISVAFLAAAYRITQSPIWNILWLIVSVLVTGYATFWDLYMDWGFFQPNSKNRFLRDELVFPYKSAYYFAMGSDLFLRAAWLLNISPSLWGIFYDHRIVAFVLAVIEILR